MLSRPLFLPPLPWASILFLEQESLTPISGLLLFLVSWPEMPCPSPTPTTHTAPSLHTGLGAQATSAQRQSRAAPHPPALSAVAPSPCCSRPSYVRWSATSTQHRAWTQQRLMRLLLKERVAEGLGMPRLEAQSEAITGR